jgi:hypothetical protein
VCGELRVDARLEREHGARRETEEHEREEHATAFALDAVFPGNRVLRDG